MIKGESRLGLSSHSVTSVTCHIKRKLKAQRRKLKLPGKKKQMKELYDGRRTTVESNKEESK